MSFSTMLEILQEKNKNSIVLIKTGVFYIATGKDAVFLNNVFQLQCICFKKQGVNFCGYKINEYRLKIRDKGKRKLKKKVKELKYKIRIGEISSKEAKKYLAGHLGYINIANVYNLSKNVFYVENEK